jgi:hypothetical protein
MALNLGPESEDEKNACALSLLRRTNPQHHKRDIENEQGGVLEGSCDWVFKNDTFHTWWTTQESHLLWINGEPGKGKTMIALAAISEIERRKITQQGPESFALRRSRLRRCMSASFFFKNEAPAHFARRNHLRPYISAFFFFKNEVTATSNAFSALQGLMFLLVDQKEELIRHVRKRMNLQQNTLFQGSEPFNVLEDILSDIARDPECPEIYLVVDALDECLEQKLELLSLIANSPKRLGSKVKWLVTSRNEKSIEEALQTGFPKAMISLELNADNIKAAVALYINAKVDELSRVKGYSRGGESLEQDVKRYLTKNSEDTFLWVALVYQELRKVLVVGRTMSVLRKIPAGLRPLYLRMLEQIREQGRSDSGGEDDSSRLEDMEHRKLILAFVSVSLRPPSIYELGALAGIPDDLCQPEAHITDLVNSCGSFLKIRNEVVSFVHLSATEFFEKHEGFDFVAIGFNEAHLAVFRRSCLLMTKLLKQDICRLGSPGVLIQEATSQINQHLPRELEYPCCYWIDHLWHAYGSDVNRVAADQEAVDIIRGFLERKLLNWLEALSLQGKIAESLHVVEKLQALSLVSGADCVMKKLL